MGSTDSARRLQVARSLWTSEPQVLPEETRDFGVPNQHGEFQAWYGIGQSLVFLPADIATQALLAPADRLSRDVRSKLSQGFVAVMVLPLVAAFGGLAARRLLLELGFTAPQAFAGTLALFWGTTFLHYAQIGQENSLEFALIAGGLAALLRWVRTEQRAALMLGALILGFLILIRATHAVTIFGASVFVATEVALRDPKQFQRRAAQYFLLAVPIYTAFVGIDRLYHWMRFGELTSNYMQLYTQYRLSVDSRLPANYPYSTPFWSGFLGPLIHPGKSIFLYDPLFVAALAMLPFATAAIRRYAVLPLLLTAFLIWFFARYFSWQGGSSWANRFTTVPVQLVALLTVPLAMQGWQRWSKVAKGALAVFGGFALIIQIASVWFWQNLEIYQTYNEVPPHLWMRLQNIAQWTTDPDGIVSVTGKRVSERLRSPNFFPFTSTGALPNTIVTIAQVGWYVSAVASVATSVLLFARLWGKKDQTALIATRKTP